MKLIYTFLATCIISLSASEKDLQSPKGDFKMTFELLKGAPS